MTLSWFFITSFTSHLGHNPIECIAYHFLKCNLLYQQFIIKYKDTGGFKFWEEKFVTNGALLLPNPKIYLSSTAAYRSSLPNYNYKQVFCSFCHNRNFSTRDIENREENLNFSYIHKKITFFYNFLLNQWNIYSFKVLDRSKWSNTF